MRDVTPDELAAPRLAWTLAIIALALVSLGGPLCWLSGYELATQFEDDAFYYFQIARHVALGHGFTFDGLHATNGFHPLWLALLVPLFRVLPPLDAPVRAAGVCEALLLGAAGALVFSVLVRRKAARHTALLGGVLVFALPGTRNLLRGGLETALCVCLLAACWLVLTRLQANAARARSWLGLGMLCALALLARLEALCALGAALWLLRAQLRSMPLRAASLVAPPLVCLVLYLAWNWRAFGIPVPVSGLVKQYWAGVTSGGAVLGPLARAGALSLLLAAGYAAWRWLSSRLPWLSGLAFPVLCACGMLGLDYVSLGHLERWYRGVAVLAAAPLVASALAVRRRLSTGALVGCAALALLRVPYSVRSVQRVQYQAELRGEAADWLRRHLPAGTRVGSWNGGMLGYYSGQHVVILDGLANSPAYYRRAILGGDMLGYLRDEHIAYLVTLGCTFDPVLETARSVDHDQRLSRSYQRQGPLTDRTVTDPCEPFQLWVRKVD